MFAAPYSGFPYGGTTLAPAVPGSETEPTLTFEYEETPGVWVNIGAQLKKVSTKRGKRRAIDRVNAGTLIAIFENSDRSLDPENPTATIFPDQAIRLKAVWNSVTYPIFKGRIERIIQQYDPPRAANAVIECTDAVAELQSKIIASPWSATMRKYATRVWFRFDENTKTLMLDDSGHGRHGTLFNTSSNAPGLLTSDDNGAVRFDADSYAIIGPESFSINTAFGLHFLLDDMPLPASDAYLLYSDKFPRGLSIYMDTLGRLNVIYRNTITGATTAYSRSTISVHGIDYQIFINIEPGQPIKIYREDTDVTDYATDIGTGGVIATSDYYGIGFGTLAVLDEFFVTDYAIDSAMRLDLALARLGWGSMTITDRLDKVLTSIGWSTANLISDFTDEILRAVGRTDVSALEHLLSISESIEGYTFLDRSGLINFIGRTQRDSPPRSTSHFLFSDQPGETGYRQAGTYALDTALLTNRVTRFLRETDLTLATSVSAQDQASIEQYGLRNNTQVSSIESELLADLDEEYQLAAYRVAHFSEPLTSIDALSLSPRSDPTVMFPEVLSRELGDVVAFQRHPQNVGSIIERLMVVEGIEHDIAPKSWTTRYHIDSTNTLEFFLFDVTLWDDEGWRFSA